MGDYADEIQDMENRVTEKAKEKYGQDVVILVGHGRQDLGVFSGRMNRHSARIFSPLG